MQMQFILTVTEPIPMPAFRTQSRLGTLENRLILACARVEPDLSTIEALVKLDPDWQEILRKTERWSLASLVHVNLRHEAVRSRVPASVAERLRHIYHRDAIRGIAQQTALGTILLKFSETGIPVIVLKGAALAALVYPSPTLRTMGDIDLLVLRHDLDSVDGFFSAMGYAGRPQKKPEGQKPHGNPVYAGGAGRSIVIEIHDEIRRPGSDAAAETQIPVEDFWKRAQTVRIASVETLRFSKEDLLLHLALHFGDHLAKKASFRGYVRTLCDIREICRRFGGEIDWSRLVTQAQHYHIAKHLYTTLCLACDLADSSVPPPVLKDLRSGFSQLPFEDRLISTVTRDEVLSEGPPKSLLWNFLHGLTLNLLATSQAREGFVLTSRHLSCLCQRGLRRLVRWYGPHRERIYRSEKSDPSSNSVCRAALDSSYTRGAEMSHPSLPSAHPRHTPGELAVTYDQSATDGVGAQLQRIYGLYALSRGLNIKYVHTPLGRVDYQGLMPLLTGRTEPDFASGYNTFFSLPSDEFDLEGCERVRPVDHLDQNTVEHFRKHAAATGHPVLLQALSGYGYTDRHPECYQALRAVTPYRGYRAAGPVRVCMHVRRGDNVPPRKDRRQRFLPNAYYMCVCSAVLEALKEHGVPFVVRLHTEMPPRPYTLHPGTPGLYFDLEQPSTIGPAESALEDFEALPNLETVLNVEAREALDDFATADVLILSLSSFSYLGGLLNPHGLVVYAPWWHPPLPDWLVATEHGDLDAAQVRTRIADRLQRRDQIVATAPPASTPDLRAMIRL